MRLGHVAPSAGTDRHRQGPSSAGDVDDSPVGHHDRHHVVWHGGALPKLFPGGRVVSADLAVHADDQFLLVAGQIDQRRRAPRVDDSFGPPDFLAGGLVERHDRLALDAGVDNQQVAGQDRRSARAPVAPVDSVADGRLPQRFAVEAVGPHAGAAEEGVDRLAVGHGRAGGVTVQADAPAVVLGLRQPGRAGLVPEDLAGGPIDAQHMQLEVLLIARLLTV